MYGCENWTLRKAECCKIDAFELRCWRKLMRVPWTARRSNQPILREINPEYSLEGLMLSFNALATLAEELTDWKRSWCWEKWRQENGMMKDGWMLSPIQWHDFAQTMGECEGQGSLVCCSPWRHKEWDTTEPATNHRAGRDWATAQQPEGSTETVSGGHQWWTHSFIAKLSEAMTRMIFQLNKILDQLLKFEVRLLTGKMRCLSMPTVTRQATVHGAAKSRTRLSEEHTHCCSIKNASSSCFTFGVWFFGFPIT